MNVAPTVSSALRAAHRRSLERMVATEAAARTHLGSAVKLAIHAAAMAGAFAIGSRSRHTIAIAAAHGIEDRIASGILLARRAARGESKATLAGELHVAASHAGVGALHLAEFGDAEEDASRATSAAKSFAAAWLAAFLDGSDEDAMDVRAAMIAAASAQGYRLDAIAATEVAQAFNDERERISDDYAARAEERGLPVPIKIWNAELDRATCVRCEKLHGTMRLWGLDFPDDEVPGDVHPRCRCVESTIVLPLPEAERAAAGEDEEAA